MIELLSSKATSGDLYINMAQDYLEQHEWGLAQQSLARGLAKGSLSKPDHAEELLHNIRKCLAISDAFEGE